jgi:AcrR family transcriptional regulator
VTETTTTDQRLVKGARTRQAIARHAADVASVEGLTGLSIGRLATDLGLSKSGVATLFGTKERLQVAAVEAAREVFMDNVVRPSRSAPHGLARLRSLVDGWLRYASEPVFPGGCFRVATTAEFDSRPGIVQDAIVKDRADWLALLTYEVDRAKQAGELAVADPSVVAFHIDAVLCATNAALQLGETDARDRARQIIDGILPDPRQAG